MISEILKKELEKNIGNLAIIFLKDMNAKLKGKIIDVDDKFVSIQYQESDGSNYNGTTYLNVTKLIPLAQIKDATFYRTKEGEDADE